VEEVVVVVGFVERGAKRLSGGAKKRKERAKSEAWLSLSPSFNPKYKSLSLSLSRSLSHWSAVIFASESSRLRIITNLSFIGLPFFFFFF
jgi:hypothetical protein